MVSGPDWRIVDTSALMTPISSQDGNRNKRSAKEDIQKNTEEGEECDASKEEGQNERKCGVDDSNSRHALHGFLPFWNARIASTSGDDCERVSNGPVGKGDAIYPQDSMRRCQGSKQRWQIGGHGRKWPQPGSPRRASTS